MSQKWKWNDNEWKSVMDSCWKITAWLVEIDLGVCGMDDFFIGKKMANYKGLLVPVADSSGKKYHELLKYYIKVSSKAFCVVGSWFAEAETLPKVGIVFYSLYYVFYCLILEVFYIITLTTLNIS